MLDRYWFGEVSRISPEAPVPVVKVERSEERLGGAANVARNAAALGRGHRAALGRRRRRRGADRRPAAGGRANRCRPACRPRHRHDRQAARHRSPAATAAHRFRDGAVARGPAGQAGRFRKPHRAIRRRHPLGLRQGRPDPHRRDDPHRPRPRQAGAGRSEGRRVGQVRRRDGDHAQPLGTARSRRPLVVRGGTRRQGAEAARRTRLEALLVTRSEEGMTLFRRRGSIISPPRRARCSTSPVPATPSSPRWP